MRDRNSDLSHRLVLGCEPLGGTDWGQFDMSEARATVMQAWDMGVRYFDTADVYGLGQGEVELCKALGQNRHNANIITKFGCRWTNTNDPGKRALVWKDASADYLTKAVEGSLRRLGIDTIPIYLLHWPDDLTPLRETLDALEELKESGKIRSFGVSNFLYSQIEDYLNEYKLDYLQSELSLLSKPSALVNFKSFKAAGLKTLAYGPLAQGLLTGKYSPSSIFGSDDRRYRLTHFSQKAWTDNIEILELVTAVAKAHETSTAQVALRWVLNKGVDGVVVGAKTRDQLMTNLAVLDLEIEEAWETALDRRVLL